ncbi:uncharacterized protein LOC128993362 [Macrosteles quadrilineatus]|uniref:uncharacterized protein LOC128993362 n=1 Tax=Macrosteles quadrilineatus TaxID=74068 RepID=UPI0023E0B218|nr:uncharacterized protein LOC128993362 [Macrosteles quadrilineatus]
MVKFSTQHYIVEHLLKRILTQTSGEIPFDLMEKELVHSVSSVYEDHVFSQADAGVQCQMSLNSKETVSLDATSAHHSTTNESHLNAGKTPLLGFCKSYLKFYENTEIDVDVLRDMYMISLNNLTHLTQLAINYSLLADGTGDALLSVGSIAKGRLKHLKLLCEPEDIPSPTHQLYEAEALQAIPDLVWHYVREKCPDLEVHIVCVSMSAYDVTKRFVTRSMPLSSFCMENGFCPTSAVPELTIFCTLKCLWLDHAETLEHVNLTLWHSTGRIDSSLVELLKRTRLSSFAYHGPLQKKKSVNEMCDAALNSSKMKSFKLMIQGDPCFPSNAKQASSHIYNQYIHRFQDKSIEFTLGTFS